MDVVVVGSCMFDIYSYVERLPHPGETLQGSQVEMGFGGKGANQCVMAAKLGAKTAMIAKVGKDNFGDNTMKNFKDNGINEEYVQQTADSHTGIATCTIDSSGMNSIVIVCGANNLLSVDDVTRASSVIENARVLLCQLEVPPKVTLQALKVAKLSKVTSIFNPAPGSGNLDPEFFRNCDICCPNETEAELITSIPVRNPADAVTAAAALHALGSPYVIITLGEQGALLSSAAPGSDVVTKHVTAEKVNAVDSVGAGDAFLGALAYFLSTSASVSLAPDMLLRCVEHACVVAAHSVQRRGAQTSYPRRQELPEKLFQR